MIDSTLTQGPGGAAREPGKASHLYLVLDGGRPGAGGARYSLEGLAEVRLGRGDAHTAARRDDAVGKVLELALADGWASSKHARLLKAMGRWVLEDQGSKNGTWVDGAKVTHLPLVDGQRFIVGRTLFVFREREPVPEGVPGDSDGAALEALEPALRTLKPALLAELSKLRQVAGAGLPLLIGGESGSGKELAARAAHALSGRPGPFVAVNAAALPRTLLEAQLFGHEKGAFTGADEKREGLLRASHRGTFFLDEVGDLPLEAQPALLRVLQEKEVTPVGATRAVPVDLRLVSATHQSLPALVEAGKFRADLYARLRGVELSLPPLRARMEDLGLLAAAGLKAALGDQAAPALALEVIDALARWRWPLNTRELFQVLAAAVALSAGKTVQLEHLPAELRAPPAAPRPATAPPSLSAEDAAKREQLLELVKAHRGNVSAIARDLGTARMQVQRWFKRFGIDPEAFR